jgi:hypothetical protein
MPALFMLPLLPLLAHPAPLGRKSKKAGFVTVDCCGRFTLLFRKP